MEKHRLWPAVRLCPSCKSHAQAIWTTIRYLPSGLQAHYMNVNQSPSHLERRNQWLNIHGWLNSSTRWVGVDTEKELNQDVVSEKIFVLGRCVLCRESSVHRPDGTLLWPRESDVVSANMDMPEAIRDHYNEARLIAAQSPRSALTLLRYCVEKLLRDNGYGKGVNPTLYDRINDLYGSTGSRRLKRALDAVRNAGNSAAHEEDIEWYQQNANVVFTLVNLVVDELYSKDDEIEKVLDAQNSSQ